MSQYSLNKDYMQADAVDSVISSHIVRELGSALSDQTKTFNLRIRYIIILILILLITIPLELYIVSKYSEWSKDVITEHDLLENADLSDAQQ